MRRHRRDAETYGEEREWSEEATFLPAAPDETRQDLVPLRADDSCSTASWPDAAATVQPLNDIPPVRREPLRLKLRRWKGKKHKRAGGEAGPQRGAHRADATPRRRPAASAPASQTSSNRSTAARDDDPTARQVRSKRARRSKCEGSVLDCYQIFRRPGYRRKMTREEESWATQHILASCHHHGRRADIQTIESLLAQGIDERIWTRYDPPTPQALRALMNRCHVASE